MGLADVDAHALELFLEVHGLEEILRRGKEQLSLHHIVPLPPVWGQH